MVITDRFVYLHQPKTGGTFVTNVLMRLHDVKWPAGRMGKKTNITFDTPHGPLTLIGPKHNCYRHIPEEHQHKVALASIRNPYDRYVSAYEFGWWKKEEYLADYRRQIPDLEQRFPGFPNLSFADYLTWANRRQLAAGSDVGAQTVEFIWRFFRNPNDVLGDLQEDYFPSGEYQSHIGNVHFIRTDDLNRGLYDFLVSAGYPADAVAFVLTARKVLPAVPEEGSARSEHKPWGSYYSPQSAEFVRFRERFLLGMFPDFEHPAANGSVVHAS